MFNWMKKKLAVPGLAMRRLEGCNSKGVPDVVIAYGDMTSFVELKDWSGSKKHPLSREQFNFLNEFGGCVLVKVDDQFWAICRKDLEPLMTSDLNYVKRSGLLVDVKSVESGLFIANLLVRSPRTTGPLDIQS